MGRTSGSMASARLGELRSKPSSEKRFHLRVLLAPTVEGRLVLALVGGAAELTFVSCHRRRGAYVFASDMQRGQAQYRCEPSGYRGGLDTHGAQSPIQAHTELCEREKMLSQTPDWRRAFLVRSWSRRRSARSAGRSSIRAGRRLP